MNDKVLKKTRSAGAERGRNGIFGGRSRLFVFAFLIFPLLQFFIFFVIVNFRSVLMAFQNQNGVFDGGAANLRMFFEIEWLSDEQPIQSSLINTLTFFVVSNLINLPLVVVFSYLLYKKCVGHRFFRIIFFMPSIIGVVVYCTLFRYLVGVSQNQVGPVSFVVSKLFALFGAEFPSEGLLSNNVTAFPTIMVSTVWTGFGMSLILISGALARLPDSIFEASKIDGVSMWGEFWNVVVPLLMPTVSSVFMLNMASMFTFYMPVMLLTEGHFKTTTIGYYIMRWTLDNSGSKSNLSYPAFVGLFVTLVAVPFVLIIRKVLDKLTPDVSY